MLVISPGVLLFFGCTFTKRCFLSLSRFQSQTQLNRSRPSDFVRAIIEARLADEGYEEGPDSAPGKVHPSMMASCGNGNGTKSSVMESEEAEDDASYGVEKSLPKAPVKVYHQLRFTGAYDQNIVG